MRRALSAVLIIITLTWSISAAFAATADDAFARLTPEKLQAVHADVAKYAAARKTLPPLPGLQDLRAVIHCHTLLSHDSRGTLEEYITAGKATNTKVFLITDHPSDKNDFFKDGFTGMHEGILFMPGAEQDGFLLTPLAPMKCANTERAQADIDAVNKTGGVAFASHIENWPDAVWNMPGLLGTEIYNVHYEIIARPEFKGIDSDPTKLITLIKAAEKFPQETFGALQSEMTDYMRRYDKQTAVGRFVAVNANDSHQNTGIVIKGGDKPDMVVLEDPLGEKIADLPGAMIQMLGIQLPQGLKAGQVGFKFQLDRYDVSFRHSSTHLLAPQLDVPAVLDTLRKGHCYVAFDWMADPTGFVFAVGKPDAPDALMGDEVKMAPGLTLAARLPLPATLKLVKDGQVAATSAAPHDTYAYQVSGPGVYRLEAWLQVGDRSLPWIYSNPIYVR